MFLPRPGGVPLYFPTQEIQTTLGLQCPPLSCSGVSSLKQSLPLYFSSHKYSHCTPYRQHRVSSSKQKGHWNLATDQPHKIQPTLPPLPEILNRCGYLGLDARLPFCHRKRRGANTQTVANQSSTYGSLRKDKGTRQTAETCCQSRTRCVTLQYGLASSQNYFHHADLSEPLRVCPKRILC